ncbi:OLC1v1036511C1 [Oldenlandia corymbosa var. corymbosa]|uniref:OLC1v1036511C1 n=1 Tax=Oldenlandia corymbosa var. corymbosa TaxID=529605 RepID=A0AAV1CZ29_OLDCO|nr:OLC1v1036511C1 [Oldenlandia corymbosa var. corymbosa]
MTKERLVSIIQENDKEPSLLDSWDIVELKNLQVEEQNAEKQRAVSSQHAVLSQRAVFYQHIETSSRFEVLADSDNTINGDTEGDDKLQEDIDSEVESDEGMKTEKSHEQPPSFTHDQILVSVDDSEIGGSSDLIHTEEAFVSVSDGEQRKKKRGRPKGSKNGVNKLEELKQSLHFDKAISSITGKIWIFWTNDFDVTLLGDSEQALHLDVKHLQSSTQFLITAVYGKSTRQGRNELWKELTQFQNQHLGDPWMVGGDFNVIRNLDEYSGNS